MSDTIKLHFGKGIKFESEYVEVRSSERMKDHLLYVNSNNQIQLLGPGNHQQNLVYRSDGFTWEDSNNIDMSLDWRVALDRDQYKTLDGNAYPVDIIPNAWKYFYLNFDSPKTDNSVVFENKEWVITRPNDKLNLTVYPNFAHTAEQGGEFYFEWMNNNTFDILENDILIIEQNIANNASDTTVSDMILYDNNLDHISFNSSDKNKFGISLLDSIESFSTDVKNSNEKIREIDLLNVFLKTLSTELMTIALYDPIGVEAELKKVFSEKDIQLI